MEEPGLHKVHKPTDHSDGNASHKHDHDQCCWQTKIVAEKKESHPIPSKL
jgi:hypothetical protein